MSAIPTLVYESVLDLLIELPINTKVFERPDLARMHPPLHTKDNRGCEQIMSALEECHARGFLYSAFGMCNDVKREVNKCLRAERLDRTAKNRERAKKDRARLEAKWAEIDANS